VKIAWNPKRMGNGKSGMRGNQGGGTAGRTGGVRPDHPLHAAKKRGELERGRVGEKNEIPKEVRLETKNALSRDPWETDGGKQILGLKEWLREKKEGW